MITLKQKIEQLPAERQRKIKARAEQLIAQEMTLRELRQALKLTQERMAELLDIRQESVSRLEKRTDLLLSTLGSYVQAMGGELKLVVEFPDRESVVLSGFSSLENVGDQEDP
jgi:transcriptional regulator with XRE-family HTH domain